MQCISCTELKKAPADTMRLQNQFSTQYKQEIFPYGKNKTVSVGVVLKLTYYTSINVTIPNGVVRSKYYGGKFIHSLKT